MKPTPPLLETKSRALDPSGESSHLLPLSLQPFWSGLLEESQDRQATDILFSQEKVWMRVGGDVVMSEFSIEGEKVLDYEGALLSLLFGERQREELHGPDGATDFACTLFGQRLRVNLFWSFHGLAAALRPLPRQVLSMDRLNLPPKVLELIMQTRQGLVLVSGPSGSGKSSTINGLVDHLNTHFSYNIITIEDPVEFIYTPKKSIINQREIGCQVESFDRAIRSAMRENPDVIVVGEIRDYLTVRAAMQAAETGHLVFATLHTRRVFTTISRILKMAPSTEAGELRTLLANNLVLLICQRLLKKRGGGNIPCREILMQNTAVASAILSEREKELNNIMLTHRDRGMVDWLSALKDLETRGVILPSEANRYKDEEEKHL